MKILFSLLVVIVFMSGVLFFRKKPVPAPPVQDDRPIEVANVPLPNPTPSPIPTPTATPQVKPLPAKSDIKNLQEEFLKYFSDGDFEGAKQILEKMAAFGKDSREFTESSLKMTLHDRNYFDAKAGLESCLEKYPTSKSCLSDLFDAEMQIGTRDDQLKAAQRCIGVMPDSPQCLNDMAIVYINTKQFSDAVSIYQRLIRMNDPSFKPEMLEMQLGFAFEGAGQKDEALRQFDLACKADWPGACSKYQLMLSR